MSADEWYYGVVDDDPPRIFGPVSLGKLCELIHTGELPYDVRVSKDGAFEADDWEDAESVEQILDAIPLDRERLMQEYIAYGEAPLGEANWGWASFRMGSLLEVMPERAWTLIIEMIDRAPSDDSLGFLAASPLEDLLSKDGPDFIVRVEERALENPKFRRALGMLRRLGMTEDVWRRVQLAAGRPA